MFRPNTTRLHSSDRFSPSPFWCHRRVPHRHAWLLRLPAGASTKFRTLARSWCRNAAFVQQSFDLESNVVSFIEPTELLGVRDLDGNASVAAEETNVSRENHCLAHGPFFLTLCQLDDLSTVSIAEVVELDASKQNKVWQDPI